MNGWIVCWTENYGDIYQDHYHYLVFIEESDKESCYELALNYYKYLKTDENIYSANLCHIIESTEAHYTNIK